ncbi:TRAP transporter small permease subunit [Pseudoroseicyclus tamaricis]|uniref:TRAP transporter small permease protein n=1 Tax=Pseudoroseicyclus tamaricis TaxID=2705421 RepID=A0A6B2JHJ2_9RHOB|nr:TRAP transporter small permease subunit [Pseudoroseicyclus tamaricis]NDV00723.1 TRAP transporter small permease subunit [Pseudoroseicyclus tamaricis]
MAERQTGAAPVAAAAGGAGPGPERGPVRGPVSGPVRLAEALARAMALAGGGLLVALGLFICVSVTGRALGNLGGAGWMPEELGAWLGRFGQIRGDYELVEMGAAICVFAFLPFADVAGAHARVEVFTERMRGRLWLERGWALLMALALTLIAWRLGVGTLDKLGNGQTSFIFAVPLWIPYAASFVLAVLGALISWVRLAGRAT